MCRYCQKLDKLKSINSRTTQQLYSTRRIYVAIEPRFGEFFLKRSELTTKLHGLLSAVYSRAPALTLEAVTGDTEHEQLRLKKELSKHPPVHDMGSLKMSNGRTQLEESASGQHIAKYNIPGVGIPKMATPQQLIQPVQHDSKTTPSVTTWSDRTRLLYPSLIKESHSKRLVETWLEKVEVEDELHRTILRAPPSSRRNNKTCHDNVSSMQSHVHRLPPKSSKQTRDLHIGYEKLPRQKPSTKATGGHHKEYHRAANEGKVFVPTRNATSSRNPTKVKSTSISKLSLSNSSAEMVSNTSATNMGSLILQHTIHDASYDNNQNAPQRVQFTDEVTYYAYPQHATDKSHQESQNSRYQHLSLLSTLSD